MNDLKSNVSLMAVLVCLLCCAVGCGPRPQHSAEWDGREQAANVRKLVKLYEGIAGDDDMGIAHESVRAVKTLTRKTLWRGEQDTLAMMIIEVKEGKRASAIWFRYVEMSFADAWRRRDVPLQMGASDHTVAALKSIAREGASRRSCVAAAMAISELDPDLAKLVFLRWYGAFSVPLHLWEEIPLTVGLRLKAMGILVPEEIDTVHEGRLLLTVQDRQRLDARQVQAAANAYNARLRKLLLAGRWAELADLSGPKQISLLKSCLDSVQGSDAAPEDGGRGLFGTEGDSAGPSIFR